MMDDDSRNEEYWYGEARRWEEQADKLAEALECHRSQFERGFIMEGQIEALEKARTALAEYNASK
jgi:hypothetical protein